MHPADEIPVMLINSLIAVNNNRLECYRYASKETGASVLKALFSRSADTSERCRDELAREVYKLGGVPYEGTLATGDFMDLWLELQSAIGRKDHPGMLGSFSKEEGLVLRKYRYAISSGAAHLNRLQVELFNSQRLAIVEDAAKLGNLREVVVNTGRPAPVRSAARRRIPSFTGLFTRPALQ